MTDVPSKHVWKIKESCYVYTTISTTELSTAAVFAQSVKRVTAEREVAGSIPGAGPILRVLK